MMGMHPDPVPEPVGRRGSISEALHLTLLVAVLEAAKVGNARQLFSYEREKHSVQVHLGLEPSANNWQLRAG
jgi:hypothetical protein